MGAQGAGTVGVSAAYVSSSGFYSPTTLTSSPHSTITNRIINHEKIHIQTSFSQLQHSYKQAIPLTLFVLVSRKRRHHQKVSQKLSFLCQSKTSRPSVSHLPTWPLSSEPPHCSTWSTSSPNIYDSLHLLSFFEFVFESNWPLSNVYYLRSGRLLTAGL